MVTLQVLAEHPDVDKVGFTGSTEVGKILRQAVAGTGKKISLELGGRAFLLREFDLNCCQWLQNQFSVMGI